MHDWTLRTIELDWVSGEVIVLLLNSKSELVELKANGVRAAMVNRAHPWGESVSIYGFTGPVEVDPGFLRMEINVQSGDLIIIEAMSFVVPVGAM